jgi:hypothetical protein
MNKLGIILKLIGGLLSVFAAVGAIAAAFGYILIVNNQNMPLIDGSLALILIGIGAVLFIVGFVLQGKESGEAPPVVLDMGNLGFIENAIKKTRNRALFVGLFIGLFGVGMIGLLFLPEEDGVGTGGKIGLLIFGLLCILMGAFMVNQYSKLRNIKASVPYRVLMTQPQTITKYRTTVVESKAGKSFQAINLGLFVGEKALIALAVTETELELLIQYLKKHNPAIVAF